MKKLQYYKVMVIRNGQDRAELFGVYKGYRISDIMPDIPSFDAREVRFVKLQNEAEFYRLNSAVAEMDMDQLLQGRS
jgi:hypothetical protein